MTGVAPPAGYSGTPLPKKLGLRDGMVALFVAVPQSLAWLGEAAAFMASDHTNDWREIGRRERLDFVHLFTASAADLGSAAPLIRRALKPDGTAWISWPKKTSKRPTDITEDTIRDIVLPLGLVDVKVAAVDDVWSGLKLVIRKELRG